MLAVSPRYSPFGWFLEDHPIINSEQLQNNYCFSTDTTQISDSITDLRSLSSGTQANNGDPTTVNGDGLNPERDSSNKIIKKLNHNARERDRRKRINTLYCSLRSLLPPEDQPRKLSIPATVSKVLKYIPELQKEVKKLVQKRESLMPRISIQEDQYSSMTDSKDQIRLINQSTRSSSSTISVSPVSNGEIVIQISLMSKSGKAAPFSDALASLEQEGFLVLNVSCFESCEGRVFYNLHLQAQGVLVDAEMLKEKLWSLFEKGDEENCVLT